MERKYAVGYRKPPTHSRFKKGKSGNPKGRPKGSRNFSTDVKATLEESIRVTSHGKAKTVSTQLAALLRRRRLPDAAGGRARSALHCSTGCLSMLQKLSMPLAAARAAGVPGLGSCARPRCRPPLPVSRASPDPVPGAADAAAVLPRQRARPSGASDSHGPRLSA